MRKEFLDKVINKKTMQETCFQYSGKYVDYVSVEIGEPLKIRFENGGNIKHEKIIDVSENEYGYWIETVKKFWKFDYK